MKLMLEAEKREWSTNEVIRVRLLALNDGYDPAVLDRRGLIGPNPGYFGTVRPFPIQVEPAFSTEDQNQVILNPWCFYGRERTFSHLPAGKVTFYGYLVRESAAGLLPAGPADPANLLAEADPLVLTIIEAAQA